jgi:UDP-glucose 4-epimerase
MKVLVTGGAGYIGSHCVHQLLKLGHEPIVIDNLVTGHIKSVPPIVRFYKADLKEFKEIFPILAAEEPEVVMHFAGSCYVGESVFHPLKYYENNVVATCTLLKAMQVAKIEKIIFSSSCAVYGQPDKLPITLATPLFPINPYGRSKLMIEKILSDLASLKQIRFVALRYFNVAGASPDGLIGEVHYPETHLIPCALQAAIQQDTHLKVFGSDYNTKDGTCERDYVHVDDICRAHILSLDFLQAYPLVTGAYFNLGNTQPVTILDVIHTVETVTGLKVPFKYYDRRAGDPSSLYTELDHSTNKILGWNPQYTDIKTIIETAWQWHSKHPKGYN